MVPFRLLLIAVLLGSMNPLKCQIIFELGNFDYQTPIISASISIQDTFYQFIDNAEYSRIYDESNSALFYEDTGITYSTNGSYIFSAPGDTIPGSDSLAYHPSQGNSNSAFISFGPGPDLSLMLPDFHIDSFSIFTVEVVRIFENGQPTSRGIIPRLHQTKLVRTGTFPFAHVVEKKRVVFLDTIDQGMSAVRHGNGRDWWITLNSRNREEQHLLLFSPTGIQHINTQVFNNLNYTLGPGQSTFSPDGKYYAKVKYRSEDTTSLQRNILIYEFDRCSGSFTPKVNHTFALPEEFASPFTLGLGLSFSQNSRFIYISDGFSLDQYDLQSVDFVASKSRIFNWSTQPQFEPGQLGDLVQYLKLTPNGEILVGNAGANNYFHRILSPNIPLDSTGMVFRGLTIPINTFGYLANHPSYTLGPLENSPCDTLNIDYPPPLANFRTILIDSTPTIRFYDSSSLFVEDYYWEFGDGEVSQLQNPIHSYEALGDYEVCLTVSAPSGSDTKCKQINLDTTTSTTQNHFAIGNSLWYFPNPASNQITINREGLSPRGEIELYDLHGRLLKQKRIMEGAHLNVGDVPSGVYVLLYKIGDRIQNKGRVVIQHE